jgi:hypothetical protein
LIYSQSIRIDIDDEENGNNNNNGNDIELIGTDLEAGNGKVKFLSESDKKKKSWKPPTKIRVLNFVKVDWMILKTKQQMYFNSIVQNLSDLLSVIDDLLLSMIEVAAIVTSSVSIPLLTPSNTPPPKKHVETETEVKEAGEVGKVDGVEEVEKREVEDEGSERVPEQEQEQQVVLKTQQQMYFNSMVQNLPDLWSAVDDYLLSMMQVASPVYISLLTPGKSPPLKTDIDTQVKETGEFGEEEKVDGVEGNKEGEAHKPEKQQKQPYESLPSYQMILQKLQELKSKKWEHVMNYSMYITLPKADKKTLQPLYVKLSTLLLTHGSIIYQCSLQEVEKEYAKYLYYAIGQQVVSYNDLKYFAGKLKIKEKKMNDKI